jgi:hypothetical protein
METAQDMNTQLRLLVGTRIQTSIGTVKVRKDGDGVEVNVHRELMYALKRCSRVFSIGSAPPDSQ